MKGEATMEVLLKKLDAFLRDSHVDDVAISRSSPRRAQQLIELRDARAKVARERGENFPSYPGASRSV